MSVMMREDKAAPVMLPKRGRGRGGRGAAKQANQGGRGRGRGATGRGRGRVAVTEGALLISDVDDEASDKGNPEEEAEQLSEPELSEPEPVLKRPASKQPKKGEDLVGREGCEDGCQDGCEAQEGGGQGAAGEGNEADHLCRPSLPRG